MPDDTKQITAIFKIKEKINSISKKYINQLESTVLTLKFLILLFER